MFRREPGNINRSQICPEINKIMNEPLQKQILLANLRSRVRYNQCVYIVRTLRGSSKINVVRNQEVNPPDLLGIREVSPGFMVINISRELKLSPLDAMRSLQKPIGKPVYKGELLAQKKNLFGKKNILAPTDCIIDKIDEKNGDVMLRLMPKQVSLISGVYGIVHNVDAIKGEVLIKTMATEIWGMFGSGFERSGFLNVVGKAGDLVHEGQIVPNMRGQIVVAGGIMFGTTLKKAAECQLAGVVCGGLNFDDYMSMTSSIYEKNKTHSDIGMSIIALEGFGPIPIAEDAYSNLVPHIGKFVFVSGESGKIILPNPNSDSIITARKTELPPYTPQISRPDAVAVQLKTGMYVRIIWPPFMGVQGKILSIDESPTYLDSGILTYAVVVETASKKIRVPYSNVEVIG